MKKTIILTWVVYAVFGLSPLLAQADVLNMPQPIEPAPAPTVTNEPAPPAPDSEPTAIPPMPVSEPAATPMNEPAAMPASEPAPASEPMPTAPASTLSETTSQTVPGRGMHMDQVEARFGSPKEKIPAVGEPPITRWNYGSYTVYFERDIVIDSVVHRN